MIVDLKQFSNEVAKLQQSLDRLTYYQLLGVNEASTQNQIKEAFFRAAAFYHPDRFTQEDQTLRDSLYVIFKRLNEAYHTLIRPEERQRYNEGLTRGDLRLHKESRLDERQKKPEDTIMTPTGRQFYQAGLDAIKAGDLNKAKLNFQMALTREGMKNDFLILKLTELQSEMKKKKKGA